MGYSLNQATRFCIVCAFISINFLNILVDASQVNQADASSSIPSDKLDAILDLLEALSARHDELSKSVQNCCANQVKINYNNHSNLPQNIDHQSSRNELRTDNVSLQESWVKSAKTGHNKIDINQVDANGGKSLFHVNKLSSKIANSIPSSSSPWTANEEGNLKDWLAEQEGGNEQSQVQPIRSSISEHYERVSGAALENLSSLMREQLVAFRISLNKLMNRVVDNSYQYSAISNQLDFIKDECSLAAANLVAPGDSGRSSSGNHKQNEESPCNVQQGTSFLPAAGSTGGHVLRTSDMALLVRLLSSELEHIMAIKSPGESSSEVNNEAKHTLQKLNEIDSIVKQSALLLAKLSSGSQASNHVVITYNSTDSKINEAPFNSSQTVVAPATERQILSRRWFPGSKVPGRNADDQLAVQTRLVSSVPQQNCQSKTSLVRPTSCQHLRLAGANCTGQYYVFVRGSIRHVYCDMNMDSDDQVGGWTVILRRIDKSLSSAAPDQVISVGAKSSRPANQLLEAFKASQTNFELDWANYKSGFGQLNEWAEFFIGLDLLHLLTANQTNELQLDLETSEANQLHLKLDHFLVGDEASHYKLTIADSCNSSSRGICEPLTILNQAKFYTPDRKLPVNDGDDEPSLTSKAGGCSTADTTTRWWLPKADGGDGCRNNQTGTPAFTFTGPIGRQSDGRVVHLYWPNWPHSAEPIRRLMLKVRQKRTPASGSSST